MPATAMPDATPVSTSAASMSSDATARSPAKAATMSAKATTRSSTEGSAMPTKAGAMS